MSVYFKEPRFKLTAGGEFLVRLVTYVTYAVLVAVVLILSFSDVSSLQWAGVLLTLFLADRLLHVREAEKTIVEAERRLQEGKHVNLADVLAPSSYHILNYAFRKSLAVGRSFHLILFEKLLYRKDVKEALGRLSVSLQDVKDKVRGRDDEGTLKRGVVLASIDVLVRDAYKAAIDTNEKFIEPRSLLVALAKNADEPTEKILELFELGADDLEEAIIFGRYSRALKRVRKTPSVLGGFAHRPTVVRERIMNRAWTARPTRYLDRFSTDLTALARSEKVGFLIGHKKEFDDALNVLSRPAKPNVLLVGEPGVGKSTMIAHLAFRVVKDKVPKILFDKRLISLEIGSLIADAGSEEVAGRLKRITEEILIAGNIVLFIPNIHDLFKSISGGEESFTAMDILLPIIKNNAIPVIGGTYPREFKQYIEENSNFLGQFEKLDIKEISSDEAIRFLTYQSLMLEGEFKIFITLRAIKKAVFLAHRYLHKKPLPSSAVDLLKQALAKAAQAGEKIIDEDAVVKMVQKLSKVPVQKVEGEELERLLNLEQIIHERLINQEAAVGAVARALREYRSGLSRRGGPIAAFLFVGPTGVGKTELAKILAGVQFGSRRAMERFDMSEYQDKQSIFRFIGTPDGKRTGTLTDAVLDRPYGLVLLDELEKAHPDILNLFLQVFDDGRLTDSLGRTVEFENTIIIATSNAHSNFIKEEIDAGKKVEEIAEELKGKLTTFFKPELLNRFSNIIVFRGLDRQEIEKIAAILIGELGKQLKETNGIDLVINEPALKKIAELGYSPAFGARPLRGVISEHIKSVLAEKILKEEVVRGSVIRVSHDGSEFRFEVVE